MKSQAVSINEVEEARANIKYINVDYIEPHPENPRTVFDEAELEALGASLANLEQLHPIHIQPVKGKPGRFRLLTGERRWRAAKLIGRKTIAAFVRDVDDAQAATILAEDNLQHVALNPMDKARAYALLTRPREQGGGGLTQTQLAKRLKQDSCNISNTMRLLKLPADWQRRVAVGEIGYRQARALVRYVDHPALLDKVAAELERDPAAMDKTESFEALLNTLAGNAKPPAKAAPVEVSQETEPDEDVDELASVVEEVADEAPPALLPLMRRSAPVDHSPARVAPIQTMLEWIGEIVSMDELATLAEAIERRTTALQSKQAKKRRVK